MRKKLLTCLMVLVLALSSFAVIACDDKKEPSKPNTPAHTHTYSDEWSNDETHHWHAATCEHTSEIKDKAEHTIIEGECTVCDYVVVSPDDGEDTPTTPENPGDGDDTPSTPEEPAPHVHTFAETWSKDATHHWYAATCEHTEEVSGRAAHDFGTDNKCDDCGYLIESQGLSFTLSDDETYYIVSGMGTCADTDIVIPALYNGKMVKEIRNYAFEDCDSLTSVTIGDGVTSIGKRAFNHCDSLTSITIPDSVTSIGDQAFSYCSSLTSVTIGDSVTSIGDHAFHGCDSLTSITIPDSVTSIGNGAFQLCSSLTSITIPDSVTSIGDDAFAYCRYLTSITIPNSVTSIGSTAFYDCDSLTRIDFTGTVEQWNAIEKMSDWNYSTPETLTIYCTDGSIANDNTVTYYPAE